MKAKITLEKFSLMNPNEDDLIEKAQSSIFRPNSFRQAKITAKNLLKFYQGKGKLGKEEKEMQIRLVNLIKGNAVFNGYSETEYLEDCLSEDSPARRIAIARLMKDTNKGNKGYEAQISFPFEIKGEKFHEALAKKRLMEDFNVPDNLFILLPDTGSDALFVDESKGQILKASQMNSKKNRSIDAISETQTAVIIWCLKYKGGTAAVGGSSQTDQGTTEGMHFSKIFEKYHQMGKGITYKNKPVFFANLVYGAQFNDHKRIVGNELAFKLSYDCQRSFNTSLDRVADIINYFNSHNADIDNSLKILYNKYAFNIEYSGIPKTDEKAFLLEWNKRTNLSTLTV